MKTLDAARNRWREILPSLGVSLKALNGKHQPCPSCGGTDRFRFDDRNGNGNYFCSQCGAGNGFDLLRKVNGWDFAEAARKVDEIIGNLPETAPVQRQEVKSLEPRTALRRLWCTSRSITDGDAASLYLISRGLSIADNDIAQERLRYVPAMYHAETKSFLPGMIAMVSDADGNPITLHRTYLTNDGKKADVNPCRKLMPGCGFKGRGAVRLGPQAEEMGVAEGIETALAASLLFRIPVWSTIAEGFLQTWQPPEVAKRIVIFGDNDANYVGQNAAYVLAKRLKNENPSMAVDVKIPKWIGEDWNDVWLQHKRETEAFRRSVAAMNRVVDYARAA